MELSASQSSRSLPYLSELSTAHTPVVIPVEMASICALMVVISCWSAPTSSISSSPRCDRKPGYEGVLEPKVSGIMVER